MAIRAYDMHGLPEPIVRGHLRCGLVSTMQLVVVLGGALALLVADPSNRWVGYVLGGALFVLEGAGWAIGHRALQRTPEFKVDDHLPVAAALVKSHRQLLGAQLVFLPLVCALIYAYSDMGGGVTAFIFGVVVVGWCHLLRILIRGSWVAGSWIPLVTPSTESSE